MSVKHNLEQWVAQLDYDDTCDITDRQVSDLIRNYAALEARCAALAAENAGLKAAIPQQRNVEFDNDSMDDVSLAEDFGFNDAIGRMKINMSNTQATDAFLAEVRAQGVEMAMEHMQSSGSLTFGDCYISLNEFATQLRKGGV